MRPEDILDSLSEIDDSLILQSEMPIRRRSYKGIVTIIAAAMLVCVSLIPLALSRGDELVSPPKIPSQMLDADVSYPEDDVVDSDKEPADVSRNESIIVFDDSSLAYEGEGEYEETPGEETSFEEISFEESSEPPPEISEESLEESSVESSEDSSDIDSSVSVDDTSSSNGDVVPYDGPIYKGYGYVEGDLPETEEEPINYLGTYSNEISKWLNTYFSWVIRDDNKIEPTTEDSYYDCWIHLEQMEYNIYPVMYFKTTDYTKDIAIYKHSSKDEYILRSGNSLYKISRARVSGIRRLIDYYEGP